MSRHYYAPSHPYTPETAARLDAGPYAPLPATAGRWPLWLAPGLWGAGLGALIVGLVWGASAWL